MLIDCDTCTARGTGCADCVVTVLLGAPPSGRDGDPVVIPLVARTSTAGAPDGAEEAVPPTRVVVELDEVERRAVRALAEGGLIPPLRHQPPGEPADRGAPHRRTG